MSTIEPDFGWKIQGSKFPILMGFEYEIDNDDYGDNLPFDENIMSMGCPHYVWEHECLGARDGWEIKSHVAPLFMHRPGVQHFLRHAKFNTEANGEENEGGIHVNISRNEYTERQHNKVFSFLHDTANYDKFLKLSARNERKLAEFAPQFGKQGWNKETDYWGNMVKQAANYYSIISLRKTFAFELRMFAAHPSLLLPAMEFSEALFALAPHLDTDITFEALMTYTGSKRKYANIHALMKEKLT